MKKEPGLLHMAKKKRARREKKVTFPAGGLNGGGGEPLEASYGGKSTTAEGK